MRIKRADESNLVGSGSRVALYSVYFLSKRTKHTRTHTHTRTNTEFSPHLSKYVKIYGESQKKKETIALLCVGMHALMPTLCSFHTIRVDTQTWIDEGIEMERRRGPANFVRATNINWFVNEILLDAIANISFFGMDAVCVQVSTGVRITQTAQATIQLNYTSIYPFNITTTIVAVFSIGCQTSYIVARIQNIEGIVVPQNTCCSVPICMFSLSISLSLLFSFRCKPLLILKESGV